MRHVVLVDSERSTTTDRSGSAGASNSAPATPTSPFTGAALQSPAASNVVAKRRSIAAPNVESAPGRWHMLQFAWRYERARASIGAVPVGTGRAGSSDGRPGSG